MRAVLTRPGQMIVSELDEPKPGPGHVLARSLACGICGSDLHAADLRHFADLTSRSGGPFSLDPESGVVLGHEFCAEVVEYGPGTQREIPAGAAVCSVPIIFGPAGPERIGYSNRFVGGLSELMLLQEALVLPVPKGLAPEQAAFTEPLAVGEHAVAMAGVVSGDVCMVIGCGPVGLAVIAALKVRGHGHVIAADFSPTRRRLAELLGADEVVDPAAQSPFGGWAELGVRATVRDRAALELVGGKVKDAVIFEAVGVPGVLQRIIDGAPARARVVVAGVCLRTDHIEPFFAVTKELELRFSFGNTRAEFATTLDRLGRGELAVESMVTDIVDLEGVAAAFDALRYPDAHGKVLVHP